MFSLKNVKIAHIGLPLRIPPLNYGGTEKIIFNLAQKQAENGNDVTVFAGPNSNITGCKTISYVNNYTDDKSWLSKKLISSKHMFKAYSEIGKEYDIIHNHVWEEGIALSFLAKVPILTTIHGVAHTKFPQKWITKFSSLTRKTKLVSISKQSLNQQKKFYGDDLIGFVHNCFTAENLMFYKNPTKTHEIELCFLGLIAPQKGAHIAIELVEKLHKNKKDVRLKIAGKIINSYENYAKKIIKLVKDKSYIEFIPNIPSEKISNLIGNSDAMIFPILWEEPFGLVMLESLYCGTPVIAFSRGSVPEIIKNGVNGFVTNNLDEMYNAVLSIGKINRARCNETVESEFSIESMYQKYMEFYKLIQKTQKK